MLATSLSLSLAPATADVDSPERPHARPTRRRTASRPRYTNPLPVEVADPCVLRHAGGYYLYGTSEPSAGIPRLVVGRSGPLGGAPAGVCQDPNELGPGPFLGAVRVEHGGAFYLYYNAVGPVGRGGAVAAGG